MIYTNRNNVPLIPMSVSCPCGPRTLVSVFFLRKKVQYEQNSAVLKDF